MSIKRCNHAYNLSFQNYLRYGTKILESHLILKSDHDNDMEFYIWRTQEDGKVRLSHAANNGKVFSYNKKPPTKSSRGRVQL